MRATLHALTEELRRLKTTGVKTVSIGEDALAILRDLVGNVAHDGDTGPVGRTSGQGDSPPSEQSPPLRSQLRQPSVSVRKKKVLEPQLPPPPTVELPEGDRQTKWAALASAVTSDPVCATQLLPGKKLVTGVGKLDAKLFFCGEAPGEEEEIAGEPFVGPAGQLLTKMIGAMGLERADVYIGNIMLWRPQMPTIDGLPQIGNRAPTAEEMAYCLPYLKAQLEIVQPEVVVALGATAARGLLGADSFKALGEIRGKWNSWGEIPVMVTYHPSYILRNQSNRSKRMIWEDLLQVMERINLAVSEKQRNFFQAR